MQCLYGQYACNIDIDHFKIKVLVISDNHKYLTIVCVLILKLFKQMCNIENIANT